MDDFLQILAGRDGNWSGKHLLSPRNSGIELTIFFVDLFRLGWFQSVIHIRNDPFKLVPH